VVVVEVEEEQVVYEDNVLIDYTEENEVEAATSRKDTNEIALETTVDTLEIVEDPYVVGEMVSVDGHACERAIGHDGHYDAATNEWQLE